MKITNVAIIGAGQIGSRHLQALSKTKNEINIIVIDPSQQSLDVAKERYKELPQSPNVKSISFSKTTESLRNIILDITIVATASDIRKKVILDLFSSNIPKFMILEKVVFQNVADFAEIIALFNKHETKVWVNCPRRMWDLYQFIKENLKSNDNLQVQINGSNWGLGSNAIHFIDLFYFLNGNMDLTISTELLDDTVLESKRKNFYELTGTIRGICQNKNVLSISSYKSGASPLFISISNIDNIFIVDESKGKIFFSNSNNKWQWEEKTFSIPYQSELTNLAIDSIINTGSCILTSIDESFNHHKALFDDLTKYFSKILKNEVINCPIT